MNSDYERIAQAIGYINANIQQQPSLENIAASINLSPLHFQRLFSRWTGVIPKTYFQILTVGRAKQLLAKSKPLVEVSDTIDLNSSFKLHKHRVQLDAITPKEYKTEGPGSIIRYATAPSPFGNIFIAATPRGICKLSFLIDNNTDQQIADLQRAWPGAKIQHRASEIKRIAQGIFPGTQTVKDRFFLHVSGTTFQIAVWRALLQIDPGNISSYGHIAAAAGRPKAARAVGTAIGSNPIAFLIPCHRVVQRSGKIGGYRWGETRKHAIHAWESARHH